MARFNTRKNGTAAKVETIRRKGKRFEKMNSPEPDFHAIARDISEVQGKPVTVNA